MTPTIPKNGSLSLLALGWRGLEAWREARGTDWHATRRAELAARDADAPEPADRPEADPDIDLVVVTGLPRSGTSMVMQMLVGGGVHAFTDHRREADASNPRGYFEHDRIKALPADIGWLPEAHGKAAKVVVPLTAELPPGPRYRVLLIERDLDEVLPSQSAMLARDDRTAGHEATLREVYDQQLQRTRAWLRDTPTASGLRLAHADVLSRPDEAARRIATFLEDAAALGGRPFDAVAAAQAVDPSLHRQQRS